MTATTTAPTTGQYVFGHSNDEQERLERQGLLLRPATEQWLRDAGLGEGMKVLDIGCGTGEVTRLAAKLVGPMGKVVGVDRAPEVIATARSNASTLNVSNVEFVEFDFNRFDSIDRFDAIVGRLVLMYQPYPAATVRCLTRVLRPRGIVAFADYFFLDPYAVPARPLAADVFSWVVETVRRCSPNADIGRRLHRVFEDAGLPSPRIRFEVIAGVGCDPEFERMPVDVLRSLLQAAEKLGIVTREKADIDTLHERMMAEASRTNGIAFGPVFAMASTRLPQ